jgi:hypothetical protein
MTRSQSVVAGSFCQKRLATPFLLTTRCSELFDLLFSFLGMCGTTEFHGVLLGRRVTVSDDDDDDDEDGEGTGSCCGASVESLEAAGAEVVGSVPHSGTIITAGTDTGGGGGVMPRLCVGMAVGKNVDGGETGVVTRELR